MSTVGLDEEQIRKYVKWQEKREKDTEATQGKLFKRGVYESAFKPPCLWKGSGRTSQGQNYIREIRPCGIAGRLAETPKPTPKIKRAVFLSRPPLPLGRNGVC